MSSTKLPMKDLCSRWVSLGSLAFVVFLLTTTVTWHGKTSKGRSSISATATRTSFLDEFEDFDLNHRFLASDAPPVDDDHTRSKTCKTYLYNFLNGTTDVTDVCVAFKNAYKAADCVDESNSVIMGDSEKNSTDDDVLIDDFFENWECCDSIERYYVKHCEEDSTANEVLHSIRLLGILLVLLVCTMIKAALKRFGVHWLPDACAFIIVGAIVGGSLRLLDSTFVQNKLSGFDKDLFLQILLPPIIFQAALSIDKRAFRRDLFPILAFAGLGTAFSAIAIGVITHKVSQWGVTAVSSDELEGGNPQSLPLLDCLVFGSLISSIDPVATLSILSGVGVSQTDTLYTLIFGESLLNDGVAIVLFDTLKSHLGEDDLLASNDAYKQLAKHFCVVLFGSIGIGIAIGMCCTLYFWVLRGRQTAVTEVMIFFCWALIPYYIADGLGCSGIISCLVMGFFMDYFVIGGFQSEEVAWMDYMAMRHEDEDGVAVQPPEDTWSRLQSGFAKAFSGSGHILSRSRHHVGFVAHVIASLMDTAIFAYLGLFLFNDNVWNLWLNLTAILSCVSSRAVMVVALSIFINVAVFFDFENGLLRLFRSCRRRGAINLADDDSLGSHTRIYLDRKTQMILLLAGVRGAVSFALVENIPVWDAVTKSGSKYKAELKAMTSSSIVFTLFVFGALTYITVKRGSDPTNEGHVAGSLTHRLLSEPLDSDDESQSAVASSTLEIEGGDTRRAAGPPSTEQQQEGYRPVNSNEWSS